MSSIDSSRIANTVEFTWMCLTNFFSRHHNSEQLCQTYVQCNNFNLRSAKAKLGMYIITGRYNRLFIVNDTTLIFLANGPNRTSKYCNENVISIKFIIPFIITIVHNWNLIIKKIFKSPYSSCPIYCCRVSAEKCSTTQT